MNGPVLKKTEKGEVLYQALIKAFPGRWLHADVYGDPQFAKAQIGEGYTWTRIEMRCYKFDDAFIKRVVEAMKLLVGKNAP